MENRGFWGTFVMIASISALLWALGWSALVSLMLGLSFGEILRFGIWGGLFFGLVFGFVMAFRFKVVQIKVRFEDREAFQARLNIALAEIGYYPLHFSKDFLTYKPSFQAGLLAGQTAVQMEKGFATLIGPSIYMKKLEMKLLS